MTSDTRTRDTRSTTRKPSTRTRARRASTEADQAARTAKSRNSNTQLRDAVNALVDDDACGPCWASPRGFTATA